MNYEYLKKCVSNAHVSPMPASWWDSILDHIPDHLITTQNMENHIKELHKEILVDYDKSIRKSMGN